MLRCQALSMQYSEWAQPEKQIWSWVNMASLG